MISLQRSELGILRLLKSGEVSFKSGNLFEVSRSCLLLPFVKLTDSFIQALRVINLKLNDAGVSISDGTSELSDLGDESIISSLVLLGPVLLLEVQVSVVLLFHLFAGLSLLLELASMVAFDVISLPDVIFVSPLLNKTQFLDLSVILAAKSLNFLCLFFGLILNVFVIFGVKFRELLRVSCIFSLQISNVLSITLLHLVLKVFNLVVVGCLKFGNIQSALCLSCSQVRSIFITVGSHLGDILILSLLEAGSLG